MVGVVTQPFPVCDCQTDRSFFIFGALVNCVHLSTRTGRRPANFRSDHQSRSQNRKTHARLRSIPTHLRVAPRGAPLQERWPLCSPPAHRPVICDLPSLREASGSRQPACPIQCGGQRGLARPRASSSSSQPNHPPDSIYWPVGAWFDAWRLNSFALPFVYRYQEEHNGRLQPAPPGAN